MRRPLTITLDASRLAQLQAMAESKHCPLETLCREILDNAVTDWRTKKRNVMESEHYTAQRDWESIV